MLDLTTAKGRRAQMRRDSRTIWWRTFKSLFTPHPQTRYKAEAERFAGELLLLPRSRDIFITRVKKTD